MRLVDDAIDAVIAAGTPELRAAIGSASFRDALHRAVGLLRSAGKPARADAADGAILHATLRVLSEYEQRLHDGRLVDRADVLRRALELVQRGARPWAGAHLFLVPTTRFGLRGELLDALLQSGAATLLESEQVHGLSVPDTLLRAPHAQLSTALSYLHAPTKNSNSHPASASAPASFQPTPLQLFAAATP